MLNTKLLTGLQTLLDNTEAWNSLWTRCDVTYPGNRAENIAAWMRRFEAEKELILITVWDNEQLVAALPLFNKGQKLGLANWSMTTNCWAISGDLLLDPEYSSDLLCEHLVDGLKNESWSLIKFEDVAIESTRWQSFSRALKAKGHLIRESSACPIAVTDVLQDWPAYQASWSGNHRSAVKKGIKRLGTLGDIEIERFHEHHDGDLKRVLTECFELENRTWKGEAGTSVLKSDMLDYFIEEATNLFNSKMLDLWLLKLDGRVIAFEYCAVAKGVVFSNKISFDPEYSKFSPGNVLRFHQHEFYQQDQQTRLFDMMGITCKNKAKWATRTYETSNLVVSNGTLGKLALSVGQWLKPPAAAPEPIPSLGATSYLQAGTPMPLSDGGF